MRGLDRCGFGLMRQCRSSWKQQGWGNPDQRTGSHLASWVRTLCWGDHQLIGLVYYCRINPVLIAVIYNPISGGGAAKRLVYNMVVPVLDA